jgi:hypothetical protein
MITANTPPPGAQESVEKSFKISSALFKKCSLTAESLMRVCARNFTSSRDLYLGFPKRLFRYSLASDSEVYYERLYFHDVAFSNDLHIKIISLCVGAPAATKTKLESEPGRCGPQRRSTVHRALCGCLWMPALRRSGAALGRLPASLTQSAGGTQGPQCRARGLDGPGTS